jgi:DNA-binding CsgD family transcriptional regulator
VASLASRDAEGLLAFVAEAEAVELDQPFTPELLVELGRLVECDLVNYCELDRVRKRMLLNVQRQGDPDDDEEGPGDDVFWEVVCEGHPVCVQHQLGVFRALKVSDFYTLRELRATELYERWFHPYGVEYELSVSIPSPLWHTRTFLFDRGGRRDFTERDRLVLDALQPHVDRISREARTRRLLRATLAELECSDVNESRGVVFLDTSEGVEFVTPPARRLIRDFFGAELGGLLPAEVTSWLLTGTQRLVRRKGVRKLIVERAAEGLVLTETQSTVELTTREREVLSWVARGKTNAEIARLLWLAPSTVRKHLENVYAKLGVNTRTAAVARFLGLIDAEAS